MYRRISGNRVQFRFRPDNGQRRVFVAGDFNHWLLAAMKPAADGSFVADIRLYGRGIYEYKFLADGQWVNDPDNDIWSPNPFGTFNSVVLLE